MVLDQSGQSHFAMSLPRCQGDGVHFDLGNDGHDPAPCLTSLYSHAFYTLVGSLLITAR